MRGSVSCGALLSAMVALVACTKLSIPEGKLACDKNTACPTGYRCHMPDLRCYTSGYNFAPDGSVKTDGGGSEAKPNDGGGADTMKTEAGAPGDGGGLSCPSLANPTNGTVAAPSLTPASTAVYSCDMGYDLEGSATLTCDADGTWSDAPSTCVIKDCGALMAPTNGSVAAPTTTYGSVATYSCGSGFGPSGSSTRTCQLDGHWDGSQPTCVVANCPALPGPTGGSVMAQKLTYGSPAQYSCNAGYTLKGMSTRTCQMDGTWSDTAPTCSIVDCGAVTAPMNGTVAAPTTTYGSMATFACNTGYALPGASTIKCNTDGTWSGTSPTCGLVDCGALTAPTNGTISATVTTYNSMATYACKTGYTLSGSAARTCGATGAWGGSAPTCAIADCGKLAAPMNGSVSTPITTYGSTATYSCTAGYGPSGSATRTCTAGGTWDGVAPTCVIANCPALSSPAGGTVSAPTLTYGSTAMYACNTGFTTSGVATRTCAASGAWSGTAPTCTIVSCPMLTAPTSGTVSQPAMTYGATATYGCNTGYAATGTLNVTCGANGAWSAAAPTCTIRDCGALVAPTNGSVVATTTTYGSTATYSCNDSTGYALSSTGSPSRTCGANGTWAGSAPTCVVKDCGSLTAPTNGTVSDPTTTVGSTATYACTTGYGPSGSATRTCQTNGTWSGTAPTCVIANCPALTNPVGGTVSAPALIYGSTAIYMCTAGYTLSGSATRTCQANGQWTGTAPPLCNPLDCGTPAQPVNGTVMYGTTTYGSNATYGCNTGYTPSGSTTTMCQSNQAWGGTVLKCLPYDCQGLSVSNGTVQYSSTTLGAAAMFMCNTNFTLSGGGPTVTCTASGWSAKPTCVDICTVTGLHGTPTHCCDDTGCGTGTSTPDCNVATRTCAAKAAGEACTSASQCGTGSCVTASSGGGSVCCQTACNGACDSGCSPGAGQGLCQHKPQRTKCGTITGPNPGANDVYKICDVNGTCAAAKVFCAGATRTCQLDDTHYCCDHGYDGGGVLLAPSCGSVSTCVAAGQASGVYGESCNSSSDCPTSLKCCRSGLGNSWRTCLSDCTETACSASGLNDCGEVDQSCDPAIPECSTTCGQYSYTCGGG